MDVELPGASTADDTIGEPVWDAEVAMVADVVRRRDAADRADRAAAK